MIISTVKNMIVNKTVNKKHNISLRLIELLYRKIFELIIIHFNNT